MNRRQFLVAFPAAVAAMKAAALGQPVQAAEEYVTGIRRVGEITVPINWAEQTMLTPFEICFPDGATFNFMGLITNLNNGEMTVRAAGPVSYRGPEGEVTHDLDEVTVKVGDQQASLVKVEPQSAEWNEDNDLMQPTDFTLRLNEISVEGVDVEVGPCVLHPNCHIEDVLK